MYIDNQGFIYRNKKKIIIAAVLIVLIMIGISIYFIVNNRINSATINVVASPTSAKVKIDGRELDAVGTYKIAPGEYEMEIYADGFISEFQSLVAVADETTYVSVVLEPTAENDDWYVEHPWDATAAGDIRSSESTQNYYELRKKYSILSYVPYDSYGIYIGYENECVENGWEICLVVDTTSGSFAYAMQYLKSTGVDLSPYYVKIKNRGLPFEQLEIGVPDDLVFNGEIVGSIVSDEESSMIMGIVNNYINQSFNLGNYSARIFQVKNYDGEYFGVTVAVYKNSYEEEYEYGTEYDLYRMLVGRIDGEWMVLSNADVILSSYQNPKIPVEVLDLVNQL